jgi:hypothetical protein
MKFEGGDRPPEVIMNKFEIMWENLNDFVIAKEGVTIGWYNSDHNTLFWMPGITNMTTDDMHELLTILVEDCNVVLEDCRITCAK